MRTTLIYAGIAGKGFDSIGKGMDSGWISHGLCSIAAYAKANGFEVDLIDLRTLRDWEHFRSELLARKPDVCGLTMMSVDFNPVMKAVEVIKQTLPETITVVGGAHPTVETAEVEADPNVDYIITHEGEISFSRLLKTIAAGEKPEQRVIEGERPDLDLLPFSDRDIFLNEWRKFGYTLNSPEVPIEGLPAPFVTVIAGRGCRYNCNFCQPAERKIFGLKVRRRSVDNVINELLYLKEKYAFNSLLIHDDCLTEDRPWVKEFCEAYKAQGFTQPFYCQSRADIIVQNEDMVAMMTSVGLKGFFIGFESGNQRVLNFIRKGTTVEQNIQAARVCRKYGIRVWANYMMGLPTETPDEIRDTIRMLKTIDPDYYSPAFFTPHPGSDLYDYCKENDLSLITSHDSYRRNPTEVKIKGHDQKFLLWALAESQKRTFLNSARRFFQEKVKRYASPRKVVRRIKRMAGANAPS